MYEHLLEKCQAYIDQQHTVLWGQYFDIHEGEGKESAAKWLASVMEEVLNVGLH